MVTRKLLTAMAAAVAAGLLVQHATGAEAPRVRKVPVDAAVLRAEIDAYVREHNERLRATVREDLQRALAPKVVLATDELRTKF
jgi:hypothetical protein